MARTLNIDHRCESRVHQLVTCYNQTAKESRLRSIETGSSPITSLKEQTGQLIPICPSTSQPTIRSHPKPHNHIHKMKLSSIASGFLGLLSTQEPSAAPSHTRGNSPSVYILQTTPQATRASAEALRALGYSRACTGSHPECSTAGPTYSELSTGEDALDAFRPNGDSKFIIPWDLRAQQSSQVYGGHQKRSSSDRASANDTAARAESVQAFYNQAKDSQRLLELDVYASGQGVEQDKWIDLCSFLGLGYSMVERQKLWYFPK